MARNPDEPPARAIGAAKATQRPDCILEYLLRHVGRFSIVCEHAPAVAKDLVAVELPHDLDGVLVVAGRERCGQCRQRG